MLKFVYSLFLGLLLAIFVGLGVAAFYPAPTAPEYPKVLMERDVSKDYTAEERQTESAYNEEFDAYNDRLQGYYRNASIVVLVAAVVLAALGLGLHTKLDILADGLLLGGLFSLIYSISLSFAADNQRYSFAVVAVGIAVTAAAGYMKFMKPAVATAGKSKKK